MRPLDDDELPQDLINVIDPELQKYIDTPPGVGMGIIYVQIFPSKKMYVGQHGHGKNGDSMARTRLNKSVQNAGPVVVNAFKKYGAENVRTFIVARGPEGNHDTEVRGDVNDLERSYIGPEGLDTQVPKGYNLQAGGKSGKAHPDSCKRMSKSQKKRWWLMNDDKRKDISTNIKKARVVVYSDSVKGPKYRSKLSKATLLSNQTIMSNDSLRTARREKKTATRLAKQPLRDAKKWIPLLAAAKDDAAFHKVLATYKKTLKRREVENNSVARRNGYGNPPPPMTLKEASKIGRASIAANIDEVVVKRKHTRGY